MLELIHSHTIRRTIVIFLTIGFALVPLPPRLAADNSRQGPADEERGGEKGKERDRFGDCLQGESADDDGDIENRDRKNGRNDGNDERNGENGNRGARRKAECAPGSSSGIARGDFNGDGIADLAIGVPGEDSGSGAVHVIYGASGGGLNPVGAGRRPAAQFFVQGAEGVPDASEAGDRFGSALAAGNFNGDDYSDLAIGAPGEILVQSGIGADGRVTIIFGSDTGLATRGEGGVPLPQQFSALDLDHPFRPLFAATTEADVPLGLFVFGAALAWGDFDGDDVGDLAIGVPQANGVGVVGILFGIEGQGLSDARNVVFTEGTGFPGGGRQSGDRFGEVLAGGDFNGDTVTDLAIGIPFRDVPATATQGGGLLENAGVVLIVFGSLDPRQGPIETRVIDETSLFQVSVTRPTPAVGGFSQAKALFGRALAAGDFDGNGSDDLAMAAPLKGTGGASLAGGVWILAGPLDPALSDIQFWNQSLVFPGADQLDEIELDGSPSEYNDRFGHALAAGDFNADSRDDLAIGVPLEDLRIMTGANTFDLVTDAGAVSVIYGSVTGLSTTVRQPQFWTQRFLNSEDTEEPNDQFGTKLTAWNFGRNEAPCLGCVVRTADLAIGVPLENVGNVTNAGAVNVIYGLQSANGLRVTQNPPFSAQFWTQASLGIADSPESDDQFGAAVY